MNARETELYGRMMRLCREQTFNSSDALAEALGEGTAVVDPLIETGIQHGELRASIWEKQPSMVQRGC